MPDARKNIGPWPFVIVIGLIGMLVWITVVEWGIAHKQLSELTKMTGRVKAVARQRSTGKSRSYLVVFTLQASGLDSVRLGKSFGDNYRAAQQLQDTLRVGNEVVAYYDAANGTDDDGYNYGVYQLETGNSIVYDLDQKHDEALGQVVAGTILAIIVTVVAGFQWIKSQNYFDPNY